MPVETRSDRRSDHADLKAEALHLGFDRVGIAPGGVAARTSYFLDWLNAGHSAEMSLHAAACRNPARTPMPCSREYVRS